MSPAMSNEAFEFYAEKIQNEILELTNGQTKVTNETLIKIREHARSRTDLHLPEDSLTPEQSCWKACFLSYDDKILEAYGKDNKAIIDKPIIFELAKGEIATLCKDPNSATIQELHHIVLLAKKRTDLEKPENQLTTEQLVWRSLFDSFNQQLEISVGKDKKAEIDKLDNEAERLLEVSQFFKQMAELEKKAEAGDPEAQYDIAMEYLNGDVIKKDEQKAIDFLEKAAEKSHRAQVFLGNSYLIGKVVPKDIEKAKKYLLAAGEAQDQDGKDALWNLGVILYSGMENSKRDTRTAEMCFMLSGETKQRIRKTKLKLSFSRFLITFGRILQGK
jgi:hypothetical protein